MYFRTFFLEISSPSTTGILIKTSHLQPMKWKALKNYIGSLNPIHSSRISCPSYDVKDTPDFLLLHYYIPRATPRVIAFTLLVEAHHTRVSL